MAHRTVWLLSHQSLRHLTRASLACVILVSTLIYFGKNFFGYDKILFRLFHYFVAFIREEPFLSRRNISLRKFSSFFTIVFIFGPPLFQDRPVCSQPAFLKEPLYFRGKILNLTNLLLKLFDWHFPLNCSFKFISYLIFIVFELYLHTKSQTILFCPNSKCFCFFSSRIFPGHSSPLFFSFSRIWHRGCRAPKRRARNHDPRSVVLCPWWFTTLQEPWRRCILCYHTPGIPILLHTLSVLLLLPFSLNNNRTISLKLMMLFNN